jgi:hypothetical protein
MLEQLVAGRSFISQPLDVLLGKRNDMKSVIPRRS